VKAVGAAVWLMRSRAAWTMSSRPGPLEPLPFPFPLAPLPF